MSKKNSKSINPLTLGSTRQYNYCIAHLNAKGGVIFPKRGSGNSGIGLISTIMITMAIAYTSIRTLSVLIPVIYKEKKKTKSYLELSIMINALIDYTSNAIENRWCLTDSLGRDLGCTSASGPAEYFDHPGNTEQFLLPASSKQEITDKFSYVFDNNPKITKHVSFNFPETHPLGSVVTGKIKECFKHAKIQIFKDNHSTRKSEGDESFVWITAELVKKQQVFNTGCDQYAEHQGRVLKIFTPRTLNSYALILTRDLDLRDLKSDRGGVGLRFHSPIYIGGDLEIGAEGDYTKTSFLGPVRAEGSIYSNNKPYKPSSYGGFGSQFQTEYPQFGGFQAGFVLEAEADPGLPRIFSSESPPDYSNMIRCAKRNSLKTDPALTALSNLFISSSSSSSYTIGLSWKDEFVPLDLNQERIQREFEPSSNFEIVSQSPGGGNPNSKAIVKFTLSAATDGDKKVEWTQGKRATTNINMGLSQNTIDRITRFRQDINTKRGYQYQGFFNSPVTPQESAMRTAYNRLRTACQGLSGSDTTHNGCREVNINDGPTDCTGCGVIDNRLDDFNDAKNTVRSQITGALNTSNIPTISFATARGTKANRLDITLTRTNSNFIANNSYYNAEFSGYGEINFDVSVKDFAFNFLTGDSFRPVGTGPNKEPTTPNRLVFDFTSAPTEIKIASNTGPTPNSSWQLMRSLTSGEPNPGPHDIDHPDIPTDPDALDLECQNGLDSALATHDWDVSFTDSTRFSWLFKTSGVGVMVEDPEPEPRPEEVITNSSNMAEVTPSVFANRCVIPASTDWVMGMYICKELVISGRTNPLKIIGTFITEKLTIANRAIGAGIDWYTIWHPEAVDILYDRRKLKRGASAATQNCNSMINQTVSATGYPLWHPNPPGNFFADTVNCSPAKFIYESKLDNFLWTTVDPERGLISGEFATRAKIKRYKRFNSNDLMRNIQVR